MRLADTRLLYLRDRYTCTIHRQVNGELYTLARSDLSLARTLLAVEKYPVNRHACLMNVEQVKKFCVSLPGAIETLIGPPANVLSYKLESKRFAYFKTSAPEQWRFSVRVSAERFIELTDMPRVKPAKYMGRYRWVTIVDVDAFDPDYLIELIRSSHERALNALPKRQRAAILN